MLYEFYYILVIVKTCKVFCLLTSVFVLTMRYYFTLYNVRFIFFSVNIKFYSWDKFFYYVLIDADGYISGEEANWKFD